MQRSRGRAILLLVVRSVLARNDPIDDGFPDALKSQGTSIAYYQHSPNGIR